MRFPPEKNIQEFLTEYIRSKGEITPLVTNFGRIETINPKSEDLNTFEGYVLTKYLENCERSKSALYDIELLGQEVPIIKTKGKALSIDILAYGAGGDSRYLIFELKRSKQSERQTVTEILAYAQGILNKFPELSKDNICCIIISSEWRPTLWYSVLHLIIYQGLSVIPLKIVDYSTDEKNKINSISLEWVLEIPKDILKIFGGFNKKCFDTLWLLWEDKKADPRAVSGVMINEMNKRNIHGFVVSYETGSNIPCPYGIAIGVLNPYAVAKYTGRFIGLLKEQIDNILKEEVGADQMLPCGIHDLFDYLKFSTIFGIDHPESDLKLLDEIESITESTFCSIMPVYYKLTKNTEGQSDHGYLDGEGLIEELKSWNITDINYSGMLHDYALNYAFRCTKKGVFASEIYKSKELLINILNQKVMTEDEIRGYLGWTKEKPK